jgi:hypothetical protein
MMKGIVPSQSTTTLHRSDNDKYLYLMSSDNDHDKGHNDEGIGIGGGTEQSMSSTMSPNSQKAGHAQQMFEDANSDRNVANTLLPTASLAERTLSQSGVFATNITTNDNTNQEEQDHVALAAAAATVNAALHPEQPHPPQPEVELAVAAAHAVTVDGQHHSLLDGATTESSLPDQAEKRQSAGKKRVRRVGNVAEPRKEHKGFHSSEPPQTSRPSSLPHQPTFNSQTASPQRALHNTQSVAAAASAVAIEATGNCKGQSKHDEKWNAMLEKLIAYEREHKSTMVPQCYHLDPRLGRWVHYQRVEYWLYQSSGKGKINTDRIARLEAMGFEWDPQRAQWNLMYDKLLAFAAENGHCKVPKGYQKDPELANWVRNQRLEFANLQRGRKTRMNQLRLDKLNAIGFKWSTSMPFRVKGDSASSRVDNRTDPASDGDATDASTNAATSHVTAKTHQQLASTNAAGSSVVLAEHGRVETSEILPQTQSMQEQTVSTISHNPVDEPVTTIEQKNLRGFASERQQPHDTREETKHPRNEDLDGTGLEDEPSLNFDLI